MDYAEGSTRKRTSSTLLVISQIYSFLTVLHEHFSQSYQALRTTSAMQVSVPGNYCNVYPVSSVYMYRGRTLNACQSKACLVSVAIIRGEFLYFISSLFMIHYRLRYPDIFKIETLLPPTDWSVHLLKQAHSDPLPRPPPIK